MDLSPEERVRFLDKACAGDAEIRREVESLLTHDGASERRIAEALAGGAQSLFDAVTLKPGTRVGDYEVHKLIGSGGMGEVYQARDLRLARNVAIKVLPPFLMNDPDRLRRFEQEARASKPVRRRLYSAARRMRISTRVGLKRLAYEISSRIARRVIQKCYLCMNPKHRKPSPVRKIAAELDEFLISTW